MKCNKFHLERVCRYLFDVRCCRCRNREMLKINFTSFSPPFGSKWRLEFHTFQTTFAICESVERCGDEGQKSCNNYNLV